MPRHRHISGINSLGQLAVLDPETIIQARIQRGGDTLFPRSLEKFELKHIAAMGILPVIELGGQKLVPMAEFDTDRRRRINTNRDYYNGEPPTHNLNKEDPNKDMMRIFPPLPKEIVDTGAKFLFSGDRFHGVDSFVFEKTSAKFRKTWELFWRENRMDELIKRVSRTALWSGDCFLKFHSEIETNISIIVPKDEAQELKEDLNRKINISVAFADPVHFHAVAEPDNIRNIVAWVQQFQRADKTFFREEIFKDMTFTYEGVKKEIITETSEKNLVGIRGSGLKAPKIEVQTEFIEFTLVGITEYKDFNDFPLICFKNDPDNEHYGRSQYHTLFGKFDALNDIFTRTFHALQNQATPLLYGTGIKDASTEQDVHASDSMWCFPDKDAKLAVLQWEGTPKAVFDYVKEIKDMIYRSAGVPKSQDMQAFTNISGEALSAINSDVVDTTEDRRGNYEESFRDLVRLVRKVTGAPKEVEKTMTIRWGPVFPEDKNTFNEAMLSLFREKVIRGKEVIRLNRLIPDHMKEDLMKVAEEMEVERERLKEEAILAQSQGGQGGGGSQAKRVTQRAGGQTSERGKATPKPGGTK